jgi:YHS domain-containing protein
MTRPASRNVTLGSLSTGELRIQSTTPPEALSRQECKAVDRARRVIHRVIVAATVDCAQKVSQSASMLKSLWMCALVLAACAPPAAPPPLNASTPSAMIEPGRAKPGDRSWCLVSGEEFVVATDSPKVAHDGKTYYFCCAGCDASFAAEPQKYLGRKPK